MAEDSDLKETAKGVVHQYVEKAIKPALKYVASWRAVSAMIKGLQPETIEMIDQIGPGIGAIAAAKLPDSVFISAGAAAFVKNLILEVSKNVGEVLKENRDATEEELSKVVDSSVRKVEETMVVIDQYGHFHMPDCARIMAAPGPRRQKGQNGPMRNELPFKSAVDQNVQPATCCYKRVEETKKEAAKEVSTKASAEWRGLSPLEVIGDDPLLGKELIDWLDSLPSDQKRWAVAQVQFLDSHKELVGLMACPAPLRMIMLPGLENRDARVAVKKWFSQIGDIVEKTFDFGMSLVSTTARQIEEWDATYVEPAAQVRAEREVPVATRVARNQETRAAARRVRRTRKPWYVRMFL